jgi:hypothetical protein
LPGDWRVTRRRRSGLGLSVAFVLLGEGGTGIHTARLRRTLLIYRAIVRRGGLDSGRLAGNSTGIGLGWRIFGFVLRCLYLALRIHLRNKKARLYSVQSIEFRTHLSKSRINDS